MILTLRAQHDLIRAALAGCEAAPGVPELHQKLRHMRPLILSRLDAKDAFYEKNA